MKPGSIILILIIVLFVVILFYSFSPSDSTGNYPDQIKQEREQRDAFMRSSPDSPFASQPDKFTGLKYYPVDPRYRVMASLQPIEHKKTVMLATSDGLQNRYLEYAHASFELDGKVNTLLILEVMEAGPSKGTLFLAFGDETSGEETYGAGRYLDLKKVPAASSITLDFNKAYNPYCAYNDSYSCPIPPRENLLAVPIRAGEKAYHP